jgi:hypothetical protein
LNAIRAKLDIGTANLDCCSKQEDDKHALILHSAILAGHRRPY